MKRTFKQMLALLLAVVLLGVAEALPFTASAKSDLGICGAEGGNLTWTLDSNTGALTVSGTGRMADYSVEAPAPWCFHYGTIRSVVIGGGVTSIGAHAFEYCANITEVTIGGDVKDIGNSAFCGCGGLKNVKIPDSVTSIGEFAFSECVGLADLTMGGGVTSIGAGAFLQCSALKTVTLGENVAAISRGAFYDCAGLVRLTVPKSVMSIGDFAFFGCGGMKDIYYAGSREQWSKISISFGNEALLSASVHCDDAGEIQPPDPPSVTIRNFTADKTVDYKTTITFSAEVKNAVDGASVRWFIDGQDKGAGDSYTVTKAKKSFTVQVRYVRDGKPLAQSGVETVNVKTGFFAKLSAFFRSIFGKLPKVAQGFPGVDIVERIVN